jgi:AraC-like DNA-binding protein
MVREMQYDLISLFPDFREQGFCMTSYNRQFEEKNILIHAITSQVFYPEHWGPLSIKTAFNGEEYYKLNNCEFAVSDKNYLVVNEGNFYSSYINSGSRVESFTINFSLQLVNDTLTACSSTSDFVLDNYRSDNNRRIEFYEKLNPHDQLVSPLIFKLLELSKSFKKNLPHIEEIYLQLLEKIVIKQEQLQNEIANIPAIKASTKQELYKRLSRAKDYIDSCYYKEITIGQLAAICFLNQTYFLRQFKNYFGTTPRQYIITKRMEAAKDLLAAKKDVSITDVCQQVGYNDLSSFSKLFKSYYSFSPELYKLRGIIN